LKLNVALIGIGNIGLLFDSDKYDTTKALSHIKAIFLHKKLTLKYVVDIDNTHKKKVKEFFPNVVFLNDYTKIVSKKDIDILSIATPTNTHFEILKEFETNKYIKQFFIEKPLFSDSIAYKNISKSTKNKIVVNYLRRFDSSIQNLKKNISKQNKIEKIVINYCKGLKNNGSHLIDMINFIFNNPKIISSKVLYSSVGFSKDDLSYDIYCTIKYKNDIIPIYFISHNHTKYNIIELNIYTQQQYIKYNNSNSTIEYFNIITHPLFPTYNIYEPKAFKTKTTKGETSMYDAYNTIVNNIEHKSINNIPSFTDEKYNIKFLNRLLKDK
jgi:predicted dehydrogenase